MYRFLVVFFAFVVISCGKKEPQSTEPLYPEIKSEKTDDNSSIELGKKIFNGKGQCLTCHKTNQNVLGPSIVDIVSIYKKNGANMVEFLKGNLDPIVDPSQFQVMKVNLEITKKMPDEELQAIVDYMYHLSEK